MYRKKRYEDRVAELNQKAKNEVLNLLLERNIDKMSLSGWVQVVSQHPNGEYDFFPVSELQVVEVRGKKVPTFDYEGGSPWYNNPVVWCEICDEVRSILAIKVSEIK